MKKILLICLYIIPVIIYSCGEDKTEQPKEETQIVEPIEIDACSLIDKEVIEKIFHSEMNDPKKGRSQKGDSEKASFSECSFSSTDENSVIYLSVYIRFTSAKDEYHTTIQNVRNSFNQSGIEIKDIDGIGEVAFWGGNQLHVFKGDNYYFIITLLGVNDQNEAIEKAKTVALHIMNNTDML
ncbi:MAG: hypothetical protein EHM47_10550 [Ignavibacteriales bacterium]|nr:MAG: hypothetical protein EHM47_10550 [Ignavibacteriales bacterium]